MTIQLETKLTNIQKELEKLKTENNQCINAVALLQGYFRAKLSDNDNISINQQNEKSKIISVNIKQQKRSDVDMKYISYRITDKRYIGRKTINKRRISVYGKTQKECYEKLKNAIDNFYKPTKLLENKKSNNLINYFNTWYIQNKEPFISEGTKKDIMLVKTKIQPLHNIPINKITKTTIFEFLQTLENNRSKEKVILYLKAMFKSAILDKIIKDNPFDNLKTAPRIIKTKPAFTYEEQEKIIHALKNHPLKSIILIYLITGMRKNEFNFKSIENDIDFKTKILKTINLKGRNKITRYKQIKLSNSAISLIMNNLDIIHKYNSETAYREFNNFLKEIEIKGSIVTCRHTFATNCFYLGKPELIISREMGHSRSEITKDVYTDIDYNLSKNKVIKLYNNLYNLE